MKNSHLLTALLALLLSGLIQNAYAQRYLEPQMVFVKGGTFLMGNEEGQDDEKPVHEVELNDFYIGKYEVTEADFQVFAKEKEIERPAPPPWHGPHHPALYVTWDMAVSYCDWLSEQTGLTYRLPTEAEWEYAARGGQQSKGYLYSGSNLIDDICVYSGNSQGTMPVGSKQPNELGIYDMSGNAIEWCHDHYDQDYYSVSSKKNPQGPESGWRIQRGGSWVTEAYKATVSFRDSNIPSNGGFTDGFRLVKEVEN